MTLVSTADLFAVSGDDVFRIPYGMIHQYEAMTHEEEVESTIMSRIRLKGPQDLIYDPIADMFWDKDYQKASAAFFNRLERRLRYEVISFDNNLLDRELNTDAILAYLRDQEQQLAEADFKLLLPPEDSNGPARFRILGQRALSFSFSYLRGEDRIIRGENWIEKDGFIFIVAVEAHNQEAFNIFFERVRQAMNSMRYNSDK